MENRNYDTGSNYQKDNNMINNYQENVSNMYYNPAPKSKNNTLLMIVTIVLSFIAITASTVAITLKFTDSSDNKKSDDTKSESTDVSENTLSEDKDSETVPDVQTPDETEYEEVAVKTMYVDCNTTLVLRDGPGKNYGKILSIPTGDALEYIKDAGNNFAKVRYNGTVGYVSMDYLSDIKPEVWHYNEREVEEFTKEVLYAFVISINTDDVSYLTQYLSGQAVSDAHTSHNQVKAVTESEEVLSVNCHSVKRVAKNQVTVVRESKIRVYRYNGSVDDVSEKYLTTVENTPYGMRVVNFEKIK